jgi:hypothetical protein
MGMAQRSTVQAISALRSVSKSSEGEHRQTKLCMTWAVDRTTGKLVARWAVVRPEPPKIVPLSTAA